MGGLGITLSSIQWWTLSKFDLWKLYFNFTVHFHGPKPKVYSVKTFLFLNNHTGWKKMTSVCLIFLDARCPMECRATEDLSESDVLLVDDQLNVRGQRLRAACVLCLTQTPSAMIFVCQGQSHSFCKNYILNQNLVQNSPYSIILSACFHQIWRQAAFAI